MPERKRTILTEREERFARINQEAAAIIDHERAEREKKTAKLRELRLAKMNLATASEPAAIKNRRTLVMIKAAMRRRKP